MSAETAASKESSPSVQLFQRAHQKMVMLQRVEDQIQQLLGQRRSIQDELRGIQVQINEEFDKLLRATGNPAVASRMLADIADEGIREGGIREGGETLSRSRREEISIGD